MPKSASKSATKKASMAAPPPVSRDQAKVQLLTTMCALKDEILRASDEKLRALKWAALNDFDKDAGSLEALLSQLEARVSGWRGDAPEGTSCFAPRGWLSDQAAVPTSAFGVANRQVNCKFW